MKFGFLIDSKSISTSEIEIKPVDNHSEIINRFYENFEVLNGWILPPLTEAKSSQQERTKFTKNNPLVRQGFFRITPTHTIELNHYSEEKARFLILAYGFMQGMYLAPEDNSYLSKTAYDSGKLNGMILLNPDYGKSLELLNSFYEESSSENRVQMFAILHWFLNGQSYDFQWDRFDAQYKVLDGLYRLSGIKSNNHASRPIDLALKYNIKLPDWAKKNDNGSNQSKLSIMRNNLVHQAFYASQPIGYAYPEDNFDLQFVSFNVKLISAVLGIKTPYLNVEPNDRQAHGWSIE